MDIPEINTIYKIRITQYPVLSRVNRRFPGNPSQNGVTVQTAPSREVKIALYAILRDLRAPKRILFTFCVHSRNSSAPCLNCYNMASVCAGRKTSERTRRMDCLFDTNSLEYVLSEAISSLPIKGASFAPHSTTGSFTCFR